MQDYVNKSFESIPVVVLTFDLPKLRQNVAVFSTFLTTFAVNKKLNV
jgi:hypothetical protein